MQPLAQFHALRLPDSFPESLDEIHVLIDRYQDIQPPSQSVLGGLYRPSVRDMLCDRESVLILALLSLDFFAHSCERVIVDMRMPPAKRFPCPQLPRLVGEVARALLAYDEVMSLAGQEKRRAAIAADYAALRRLEGRIRVFDHLYGLRLVRFKDIHPNQLTANIGELTRMLEVWDHEIYDLIEKSGAEIGGDILLAELFYAFSLATGERLCAKEVVYGWMATTLQAFRLESGTTLAIARRVKARIRSAHKRRDRIDRLYGKFYR